MFLNNLRARFGRRAIGLTAALLLEALLIILLLTLGRADGGPATPQETIVSFNVDGATPPQPEPEPAAEEPRETQAAQEESVVEAPDTPPPEPVVQRVEPPPARPRRDVAIIPLSRNDMASADLSALPSQRAAPPAPSAQAYGPSLPASAGDTEIVGQAPNGEPLYAARWYREPTDGEMRGYLSTASGPGWALIACKTAPQWRVEDCVGLGEGPRGSNIERAVLAAAWQFQVRPPKRGGQSLVGSWVRIRIDYGLRNRGSS